MFVFLRKCSHLHEEKHYSPILVAGPGPTAIKKNAQAEKIPQMPLWALQPLIIHRSLAPPIAPSMTHTPLKDL